MIVTDFSSYSKIMSRTNWIVVITLSTWTEVPQEKGKERNVTCKNQKENGTIGKIKVERNRLENSGERI